MENANDSQVVECRVSQIAHREGQSERMAHWELLITWENEGWVHMKTKLICDAPSKNTHGAHTLVILFWQKRSTFQKTHCPLGLH